MVSLKVLVRAAPILAGVAALAGCGGTSHPGTMSPSAETIQGKFVNVVKTVSPAVVQIQTSSGLGSGVVFDASPRRLAGSRNGRPAVVTDDDVRSLAITAGSEREPIVGRRAPNSSLASICKGSSDAPASLEKEKSRPRPLLVAQRGRRASARLPLIV
jgi:hypothetical protein